MKCPLLLPLIYQLGGLPDGNEDKCKKEECAWWNDRFGMCSQAVDAYLKGQEDMHRENEIIRKGG